MKTSGPLDASRQPRGSNLAAWLTNIIAPACPVPSATSLSAFSLIRLKLPTGAFDVRNADGDLAERTLQPGSGTTDALIGAYYQRSLPLRDMSWFVHGLLQAPLDERQGFRPGERVSVDLGVRYEAGEKLGLMLQLNVLARARDQGAEAETEDSGGQSLWLSPGLSYTIGKDWQGYAFLQQALHQYVNGVQLVAERAVMFGVSGRF